MITVVDKLWGREVVFANNEMYCGKLLIHDKAESKGSMHFHMKKHETFYVIQGSFKVHWIEPKDATQHNHILNKGDTWTNEPGFMHQLEALEDNSVVVEVSTTHFDEDSYRVLPGNS